MSTIERPRSRTSSSHTSVGRREAELLRQGRRLLLAAEKLLGSSSGIPHGDIDQLDILIAETDVVTAEIISRLSSDAEDGETDRAELGTMLVGLQTLRAEAHEHQVHERLHRLDALEAGLAPMRWVHDPDQLLHKVCETVVHACGFERAMLSRVEGSVWRPWKSYAVTDRQFEHRFAEWMRTTPEIPLDHLLLESEMVRRRGPAIVTSPESDPRVYRPMVEASGLQPYVAAPLMPTGRVIGFLHADYESGVVTELDRDVLWAFAEAFGQIFERAVLLSRLRAQRQQVREAMQTVEQVLEDLATGEIELASKGVRDSSAPRLPPGPSPAPGSRIESLLTPRELEVLALMATGATNSRIAEQLVITDGTVKSHVKRILRKLRAANRAEAIARYLRLTMGSSQQRA
jgi:DNA-binding CsgD family transcriptional regulator